MPIEISEDQLSNDDFDLQTDTNGDLVLEHQQTGGQFKFDSSSDAWVPVQGLDMQGAALDDAGSVETRDSVTVTQGEATNTLHYGSNQDRQNAGDNGVALGIGSRVTQDDSVAVGFEAGISNTGRSAVSVGLKAGRTNTGSGAVSVGDRANQTNTGSDAVSVGDRAGQSNTGNDAVSVGANAGRTNTGNGAILLGRNAGRFNTQDDVMIVTDQSGNTALEVDLATGDLDIAGTVTENVTF
jgi:hypothetical protein